MSLAAIHILKQELRLSDADYRALLRETCGVESAKQLSEEGMREVMKRLQSMRKAPKKTPTEAKIWAIWYDLKGFLPQHERTAAYLLGIVRRASGNEAVQRTADLARLTGREAYRAIEALKLRLEHEQKKMEVPF